jgi:hypothetical protein
MSITSLQHNYMTRIANKFWKCTITCQLHFQLFGEPCCPSFLHYNCSSNKPMWPCPTSFVSSSTSLSCVHFVLHLLLGHNRRQRWPMWPEFIEVIPVASTYNTSAASTSSTPTTAPTTTLSPAARIHPLPRHLPLEGKNGEMKKRGNRRPVLMGARPGQHDGRSNRSDMLSKHDQINKFMCNPWFLVLELVGTKEFSRWGR